MKNKINIGGHVSCAGGLMVAIENAKRLNIKIIQIHATSPRQWQVRMPDKKIADEFKSSLKKLDISCYIHAPYLINLATPNNDLAKKSLDNLVGNLKIGEMIGAKGVVFHLGSTTGGDRKVSLKQEINLIKKALKLSKGDCKLILENSANGEGSLIGSKLEEVGALVKGAKSKRVGVCLDTAHSFASSLSDFSSKSVIEFEKQIKKHIGLKNLICFHVNDSKVEFGTHRDRHENIGQGCIGKSGFINLSKIKSFRKIDWLLEVPGYDGNGPDERNIRVLGGLEN